VNCAVNGPPQVTEGVTATKSTVDYWSIQGGSTLFHIGTTFLITLPEQGAQRFFRDRVNGSAERPSG
jgi:hypothetical protein